jgi:hypothetical protein
VPLPIGVTWGPAITDRRSFVRGLRRRLPATAAMIALGCALLPRVAVADEGGTSFWQPGTFASFSAIPQQPPGWSLAITDYYVSTSAGADVATARAITAGRITANVKLDDASRYTDRHDMVNVAPGYAFATPVLGGQFSLGATFAAGTDTVQLDQVLTGSLGKIGINRHINETDVTTGLGDIAPLAQLRWTSGVHNWTTYVTGNIPVGDYDVHNLAIIGIGHAAIDGGGGYTYYDSKKGFEISAVTGLTYNFINPNSNYQSGVDWHLDWALSQALSKDVYVGLVGYIYNQISPDSGLGDHVGAFESRVMGAGPQINYTVTNGSLQTAFNLKGYYEFDAARRPSGWNTWLTVSFSPAEPDTDKPKPKVTK